LPEFLFMIRNSSLKHLSKYGFQR